MTPLEQAAKMCETLTAGIQAREEKILEMQTALLALSRAYSDWPLNVSEDEEQLVARLIQEAELNA